MSHDSSEISLICWFELKKHVLLLLWILKAVVLLTVTCLDCLVCVFSPCDLVCPSCCLVNLIRCVSFVPDCHVYLRSLKSANWNEWRLLAPSLWSVTLTVCTLKYQMFLVITLTSNKANGFCFLPTCLLVWWTRKERLLYGSNKCTCTSK